MRAVKNLVIITLGILFIMRVGHAQTDSINVDDIIRKSNHMALYQGIDCKGKVTMVITDKQGRTRKRQFNMLRRDDSESNMDQKYFIFLINKRFIKVLVFNFSSLN